MATLTRPTSRGPLARGAMAVAALVGVGIGAIGVRFLRRPDVAAAGFGVPAPAEDPYLLVKGVRDIGSGLIIVALLAVGDRRALGWALVAASAIPAGDTAVVLARGGTVATALLVHGATALVVAGAGATLAATAPPLERAG